MEAGAVGLVHRQGTLEYKAEGAQGLLGHG